MGDLSARAVQRAAGLMKQYADLPMDLADATRVFSLDDQFHVYRFHGRRRFEVLPPRS